RSGVLYLRNLWRKILHLPQRYEFVSYHLNVRTELAEKFFGVLIRRMAPLVVLIDQVDFLDIDWQRLDEGIGKLLGVVRESEVPEAALFVGQLHRPSAAI